MKDYIFTVAAAALLAAMADILAPEEWGKYIRLIVGFLILSIILTPIAKLKKIDLSVPTVDYEISERRFDDEIGTHLAENIEKDINERIKNEFGIEAVASVIIDTDEENNIKGVRKITVFARKNPSGMVKRLGEIYGCGEVTVKIE